MQQLLWFEIVSKGAIGLILILVPLTALRVFGLQRPESGFWPRLAGALILGCAAAVLVSLAYPEARGGLGPAGLIPINLTAAGALIAPLILGTAAPARRGRLFILAGAVALLALAFLEIAHF